MQRILVIEDDTDINRLLCRILTKAGYEAIAAYSGTEAQLRLERETPDMIMLDLMLPGVDGFEICREVRSQKNTPIIMVSAKKDDIDKIRGLGLGADDYMTKPFSPSELVARVKAHLARYERLIGSNVQTNDIIEIRGLKIDVYTKDELFSEIWDMESIGDIATVTVHIKKIREKIEYDTSKPQYIEAIRGVGYRFKV